MGKERNLNRLRQKLEACKLEAALITAPSSIAYFTGFRSDPMERFLALWVPAGGEPTLLVPELDLSKAEAAAAVGGRSQIVPVADGDRPTETLNRACVRKPATCGIEKEAVSWRLAEQLQQLWPETVFADVSELIGELRGRKTREEADSVREAARIADAALGAALTSFRRGMKENELAGEIDRQIRLAGGEGNAFATTVLAGSRSALPHGETGETSIVEGDFLLVDMGAVWRGYLSDMTRTFLVGKGTAEQVHMYETVREANRRAIAAVASGRPLAAVDAAARSHIAESGYGNRFPHRVGHGLGVAIHEPPSIHGGNEHPIVPGMLFTVEPGVYIPGVGGVRIEDDVYVNDHGFVETLTAFPRGLIRL